MRIIAGKYRGINIPSPKEEVVKPTLDRIKENIFNIIQFKLQDATVLDLFCGSGALGLESLSRGAKDVDFVDSNKENIKQLGLLLQKLQSTNQTLHVNDYYDVLKHFFDLGKKFDIIFLDPPYDSDLAELAIQKIFKFDLLNENGIIIWEHPVTTFQSKYNQKIYDTRVYGKIQIDFIRR